MEVGVARLGCSFMLTTLPLHAVPALVLAGMLLYLTLHAAWLASGARREPHLAWSALFLGAAVILLAGRVLQRAGGPAGGVEGVRLQYAALPWLVLGAGAFLRATSGRSQLRAPLRFLVGSSATLSALVLGSEWIVSRTPRRVADAAGFEYWTAVKGPFAGTLAALLLLCLVYSGWGRPKRPPAVFGSSRGFRALIVLLALTALNDVLLAAGRIRSTQLLEWGILCVVLGGAFLAVRRADSAHSHLNDAVGARANELASSQTQLEAALDALRERELRFRQLSEAALEGLAFHQNGEILDHNASLGRMFGATSLVGRSVESLWAPGVSIEPDVLRSSEEPAEVECIRAGGSRFPAEVLGRMSMYQGRAMGVLSVRDRSEQTALRASLAQADRLATLGTLAAGTAHEINNPLTWVTANLEAVRDELASLSLRGDTTDAEKLTEEALEGCRRIARIVGDMKSLTRARSPDETGTDVNDVVRAALKMTNSALRYRASVEPQLGAVAPVSVDADRLVQVLVNLLLNAAQALPEGRAREHHVRVATSAGRDVVHIDVEDNGSGIPTADLDRIFEAYYTTKAPGSGTGLGLAICRSIVEGAGGSIRVTSELGVGTSFRVSLPEADVMPSGRQRISSGARPTSAKTRRARVLIIDDEPLVARSIQRMLREHELVAVHSAREALETLERFEPDLVLCDLMMPEMSGMDFHGELRKQHPELLPRLVFLTGGAFTESAARFLEEHRPRFMTKPVDPEELRALVRESPEELGTEANRTGVQGG